MQNETTEDAEEQTQVNKEKGVTGELNKYLVVAKVCSKVFITFPSFCRVHHAFFAESELYMISAFF